MSCVLITSAAYVGPELAADFGLIPPAFLPVGNRRLYVHQHRALADSFDRVILSLPADFAVEAHDARQLEALGIEVVQVPTDFDLPHSILHVIAEQAIEAGGVAILHGDTLVFDIDYDAKDAVSVAWTSEFYSWASCDLRDDRVVSIFPVTETSIDTAPVLSGFFHFADLSLLVFSLAASRGGFVDALRRYLRRRPLAALNSDRWLDFGHVHTYYASRGQITTERSFNSLSIGDRVVCKQSSKPGRMEAEASWYEQVPQALRMYLPQYLGRLQDGQAAGYRLEFLYLASLADLFVFGRLPGAAWSRIFGSAAAFLETAAGYPAPAAAADDAMEMYLPKTLARLDEFAGTTGIDLERGWTLNGAATPSLRAIALESSRWIAPPESRHLTIVHGDPCFSNILYDFRSHSVRMIDPRGQDANGTATIWGDRRYDLAKLHHSAVGCYDLIVGGLCTLTVKDGYTLDFYVPQSGAFGNVRSAFDRAIAERYRHDMPSIEAICLHLFLSMLPLHADNPERQLMLMANALRLYLQIEPEHRA